MENDDNVIDMRTGKVYETWESVPDALVGPLVVTVRTVDGSSFAYTVPTVQTGEAAREALMRPVGTVRLSNAEGPARQVTVRCEHVTSVEITNAPAPRRWWQ